MTDIPKQDLLAKLLKMTTSDNDGEALVAMRKANALLTSAGWDWDKLIQGKIRVAADPFANLQTPYNPVSDAVRTPRPSAPPKPSPQFTRAPQPPPPPPQPRPAPQPQTPFEPWSHKSTNGQSNIYASNCYCCGHTVAAKAGKLFVPTDFNPRASVGKKVICDICDNNRHAFIDNRAAPKQAARPFTGPAPKASDL